MANKTLSNPTVEVNDDTITIIPNSLSYKEGQGDRNVRAESAGGNSIVPIITDNAETKISMVKFKLSNSDLHLQQVKEWMAAGTDGVTINLSQSGSDTQVPFRNMVVTAEPERAIGADGEIEVEFMGPPVE